MFGSLPMCTTVISISSVVKSAISEGNGDEYIQTLDFALWLVFL